MSEPVRIIFPLEQDEDGYPPFSTEGIWALPLPDGRYRIDNIPFYAYDVALGDVVSARRDPGDGLLRFEAVVEPSTNSTMRLAVPGREQLEAVRAALLAMGCEAEGAGDKGILSVNIPADRFAAAFAYIDAGADADKWGWEEGVFRADA